MDNLQLMSGVDYVVSEKLKVKHPKLSDIIQLGEDKYNQYVGALTMDALHIADILWDNYNIWYEDISDWQLFINNFANECRSEVQSKLIHDALFYFTGLNFNLASNKDEEYFLICKENDAIINELNFKLISQFLSKVNFMTEDGLYHQLKNAGSKGTAKYILKQITKKRNSKHNGSELQSIVSSLLWKSGVGKEIFDYPIFMIYEGYSRLNAIDNWDKTVTAYYAGNIDTEKGKINFEKINWSKNLVK